MNQRITSFICLAVLLLSACTKDESTTGRYVVAGFENSIDQYVIFQDENRVYVNTVRSSGDGIGLTTDVYRVDLRNGKKTLLLSTLGYSENFIVSADEKFISLGLYVSSPTGPSTSRIELFDLTTGATTVLITVPSFIIPRSFDSENKTLLYNIYENNVGNRIRKIDLSSGTDVLISDDPSGIVIDVNPVNGNILMQSPAGNFFMDWNGNVVGEPITGFTPRFFSPDGEKIIGAKSATVIIDGELVYYSDVVRYTIATGEIEVLTATDGQYSVAAMSPDEKFVLCIAPDLRQEFSYDLYVVDTETRKQTRLMATEGEEFGIGFFDDSRKVLFVATDNDWKNLYGLKVD
jgi:Tol biopolymer transport system component